jgi:hypothetical protein
MQLPVPLHHCYDLAIVSLVFYIINWTALLDVIVLVSLYMVRRLPSEASRLLIGLFEVNSFSLISLNSHLHKNLSDM